MRLMDRKRHCCVTVGKKKLTKTTIYIVLKAT